MKTQKEIYKADGMSFISYEEVVEYAKCKNYRVVNTTTANYTTKRLKMTVHFIDLVTNN